MNLIKRHSSSNDKHRFITSGRLTLLLRICCILVGLWTIQSYADDKPVELLRQFFRTIPRELNEAAILDGANRLQVLWHVIIPLSRPALITVAIFSALGAWNDFLGPLLYLNDSRMYTLALGLAEFTGLYSSQWHLLMAASAAVIAPVIILFFLAQKYFIEGITLTGTKR